MWKKWRLFHAIDFQSLMYPCFIFCNILGIFPYKINGTTFETSKQHYILSTVIICVFCIYELVVLYEIDVTQTVKYKGVPKTLERNCFYILGSFIAIVTHILSGPRMHLLQAIMKISWRVPFNSYRKLSRLIHAKDILGFFFLVAGGVLYYTTLDFDTWHKALVPYIHLLVFQMDMLYMNCVCVLKACFKGINNDLKNLRELLINDKPYLPRRIYHEHSNLFLLVELKALKKQHIVVSDIVQMLNMIFSLQLIASIILTFAEITFNLYFYIMHWKTGILMSNMSDQLYNTFLIGIMVYYSIKMVLIGWACETGKDEAVKIGRTIHEVLNSTRDEQIKVELQLFSLQILQYENVFSAKGLIVDANLLTAIVGNITTYVLILIQFVIASQLCNGQIATNTTQIY